MDFIAVVVGLALAILIIACVGHVLWLIIAAVWQALFTPRRASGERCPSCAAVLVTGRNDCPVCLFPVGWPQNPTLRLELAATRRQINRLVKKGSLSNEQAQ